MGHDELSLTIVIGTGRCGSTMLSRLLQMHPQVLSLSEFWNVFRATGGIITSDEMSGEEFWQRITKPDIYTDGIEVAGIPHEEFVYPADRGRFDPATGVPAICRALAQVTDDPDALYDQLALDVPAWPRRSMAGHCRALFADLAAKFGHAVVVERTGASVNLMPVLRREFPEARFVFMHRDGVDSALSMSRHAMFRLVVMLAVAEAVGSFKSPPKSPLRREMLPPEISAARPEDFEGLIAPPFDKERFLAYPLPLILFGWTWSWLTYAGANEIRKIPGDQWTTMRYERLIVDARAELSRLADFIGVPADPDWLNRAGNFVDSGRVGGAAAQLHPAELAELRQACAFGTQAFDLLEVTGPRPAA